jgi:hypothetical protein
MLSDLRECLVPWLGTAALAVLAVVVIVATTLYYTH